MTDGTIVGVLHIHAAAADNSDVGTGWTNLDWRVRALGVNLNARP